MKQPNPKLSRRDLLPRLQVFQGERFYKGYQGGTPLIDGALESASIVWVLAKDETAEDRYFLMEVDVNQGKVLSRTDLDQPFTRMSLNQGLLALASLDTSVVATYQVR